jgi:uncharacterized protein YbjT (DUF2867 family)
MNTNNNKETILVLGSTGKTGSRVANRLSAMGYPVRMGSRKADIPFDWRDRSNWGRIVEGVSAVYIAFQPDLAVPGSDDAIGTFTKIAVEKGVKHLVLLSGRGEPEAQRCEEIVMQAGVNWTIVRASWFMQNFTESHVLEPILAGHVALPVGNTGEPFIDADDIADVAVAALTQPGHSGKLYEVTGPELMSFKDAIKAIAEATGRNIQYQQISIEEYISMVETFGVPKEISNLLAYLFTEVLDGRNEYVTNGVEQAIGRKPKDFGTFVKEAVKNGAWDQQTTHA